MGNLVFSWSNMCLALVGVLTASVFWAEWIIAYGYRFEGCRRHYYYYSLQALTVIGCHVSFWIGFLGHITGIEWLFLVGQIAVSIYKGGIGVCMICISAGYILGDFINSEDYGWIKEDFRQCETKKTFMFLEFCFYASSVCYLAIKI